MDEHRREGEQRGEQADEAQVEVEPWYAVWSDSGVWPGQSERLDELRSRIGARIGERCFIARGAHVVCSHLEMGARSYIATGCVIRDELVVGEDCTLNAGAVTAGKVHIGNGVRIAGGAALFGENHVFTDPDRPIWHQGEESEGIVIHDDVWIGTHAVICDGVTVGAHSVVAAGAVVTRDVPPYSLVAGVPARIIRDRRDRTSGPTLGRRDTLSRFDARVADQWPAVLARCEATVEQSQASAAARLDLVGGITFVDRPGSPWTLRATCDAIEIAAAFGRPDQAGDRDTLVRWLQSLQHPQTGLFPEPGRGLGDDPLAWDIDDEFRQYGVLSAGYALECLGAAPQRPVQVVRDVDGAALVARLDGLPWSTLAWPAGSWVDFWGTATSFNRRHHRRVPPSDGVDTLFGWLTLRCDPRSGLWGPPDDTWGWLMPVNGAYRLIRGTFQQFDVPLPHSESLVDTVLAHARDHRWFVTEQRTACNVLDVVHPLWLAARQCEYRRGEVRDQMAALLERTVDHWVDGAGFGFGSGDEPGLQGTEMWLAIVFHLADHLGESDGLSWRPRGVHRTDAVDRARRPLN